MPTAMFPGRSAGILFQKVIFEWNAVLTVDETIWSYMHCALDRDIGV